MPVGKMLESIFSKRKAPSSEEESKSVNKKLNSTDVTNKGSTSALGVSTMTDNSDRLRENLKEAKNIMRWK